MHISTHQHIHRHECACIRGALDIITRRRWAMCALSCSTHMCTAGTACVCHDICICSLHTCVHTAIQGAHQSPCMHACVYVCIYSLCRYGAYVVCAQYLLTCECTLSRCVCSLLGTFACMRLHIFACMHALRIYVCTYVCMYVYMYVRIHVYTVTTHVIDPALCMYACHLYVCIHVCILFVCLYLL
jgi:hypothetical protein